MNARKLLWLALILAIALALAGCQAPKYKWTATYCRDRACPAGGSVYAEIGYLYDDKNVRCPATVSIFSHFIPVGKVLVPIYFTAYFKDGTCVVNELPEKKQ